ncbi:MAG TPA: metallophosphoesterase [Polyangia bacterium]|nr:metallophosphoesterase [Polyangia bacterium]
MTAGPRATIGARLTSASLLLATFASPACGPAPVAAAERAPSEPTFSVVALPDTQYYVALRPEIFDAQTRWIARRRVADDIAFVVHEGDVVDADTPEQWARAAHSLRMLDGVVPYVLSAGNHDYDRVGSHITRSTLMNVYFPAAIRSTEFRQQGTYEPGRIENSWQVIPAPGGSWLVVSLEFGPRDAVLAWADAVVKRFAPMPTLVLTHAYLAADGTRYDHVRRPEQLWNPYRYLPRAVGAVNDGEDIWRKLVLPNDSVRVVLCGHELGDGTGVLTSVRPDGTKVVQILANYQTDAAGGDGYLRLMQFRPSEREVRVRTYSPYLDRFKNDESNDFTVTY